jgi:hypothetical protein
MRVNKQQPLSLLLAAFCGCGALDAGAPQSQNEPDSHVSIESMERPASTPDEVVRISYRGEEVLAERHGSLWLVEGDITVTESELKQEDPSSRGNKGVSRQGANRRWPNGVVPFRFGTYNIAGTTLNGTLTAAEQQTIRDAMAAWSLAAPRLRFRDRIASDANFITFNRSSVCSSPVGVSAGDAEVANPLAGEQIIRLAPGCIANFSVHHEIAHSLGLHHEMTRADQATAGKVQINWGNVLGCPNAATSAAGCGASACTTTPANCGCASPYDSDDCDRFHNFVSNAQRSDIFGHDFDSVMHYGTNAFAKAGAGNTITVLENDPATGAPYAVGQRNHLSLNDMKSMRVLYPVWRVHTTFFARTGRYPLCTLEGREDDANINRTVSGDAVVAAHQNGRELITDVFGLGFGSADLSLTCSAEAVFWASNYGYPAPTRTVDPASLPANQRETFTATVTLRILNPGLIPVMFGT